MIIFISGCVLGWTNTAKEKKTHLGEQHSGQTEDFNSLNIEYQAIRHSQVMIY